MRKENIIKILITLFFTMNLLGCSEKSMHKIVHWETKKGLPVYFVRVKDASIVSVRLLFDAGFNRGNSYTLPLYAFQIPDQEEEELMSDGIRFSKEIQMNHAYYQIDYLNMVTPLNKTINVFNTILNNHKVDVNPNDTLWCSDQKKKNEISLLFASDEIDIINTSMESFLYRLNPYTFKTCKKTLAVLQSLGIKDRDTFRKKYYVARNATLLIAGDLSTREAKFLASKIDELLPEGIKPPKSSLIIAKPNQLVIHTHTQNTNVLYGQIISLSTEKEAVAEMIAQYYIYRAFEAMLVKTGLAYSAIGDLKNGDHTIYVSIGAVIEPKDEINIIQNIKKLFLDLPSQITSSQLDEQKQYFINERSVSSDNENLLRWLTEITYNHMLPLQINERKKLIKSITLDDVRYALKKSTYENQSLIIVRPPEKSIK